MSAEPAQPRFDQARAEAFAGQLLTLKPDGVYLMQDISGTSHVHGGHRASDRDVSLHDLLHALHDGLAGAGLAHDIQNNWYVVTK